MNHNDGSYATMLLVSDIRPDREELVSPLTDEEWHKLRLRLSEKNIRMGDLIGMDMSALMMRLELKEDEAYRAYLLLNRTVPLSISLEKLAMRGINETAYSQNDYPERLRPRLQNSAPAMLYYCGRPEIFKQEAIAILGAVKPRGDVESQVVSLVRLAVEKGYVIVTDGTMGISRVARDEAIARAGSVIEVLPGEMSDYIEKPDVTAATATGRSIVISSEHPDKPCSFESAQARNKIVYALCRAALIFGVERNSGALWGGVCEALKKRWCPRVYAWDSPVYEYNKELIARGVTPFHAVTPELFESMHETWKADASEQMCMFDNNKPL